MFAAGPLSDDAELQWHGDGLFVYRAESRAAAKLAEADPMHARGAPVPRSSSRRRRRCHLENSEFVQL
jgi:hypothetical protein